MRDLLNLSLDELRQLVEAEGARAALRRQFDSTESDAERLRIVEAALPHVDTQLELVRRRKRELERLEAELVDKRRRIVARRARALYLTASPLPASTAPTRARKRPRDRNSAASESPLSDGSEISRPPAVCAS